MQRDRAEIVSMAVGIAISNSVCARSCAPEIDRTAIARFFQIGRRSEHRGKEDGISFDDPFHVVEPLTGMRDRSAELDWQPKPIAIPCGGANANPIAREETARLLFKAAGEQKQNSNNCEEARHTLPNSIVMPRPIYGRLAQVFGKSEVARMAGRNFGWGAMPRAKACYRISVKDDFTGHRLRLDLVEQLWPGRFWLRVDGNRSQRLPESSLSRVCDRLRRWLTRPQRRA